MPDLPQDADKELEQFLSLVRAAGPNSVDLLESLPQLNQPSPGTVDKALEIARLARSLSKNELTLGKYFGALRTKRRLTRAEVAKEAHLSADAIGELESDTIPVQSIAADRLALLAAYLDAFKIATLELLAKRFSAGQPGGLPRLTRMDTGATDLEAERARRHTQAGGPRLPIDQYLSDFSNAFDEEARRRRQP